MSLCVHHTLLPAKPTFLSLQPHSWTWDEDTFSELSHFKRDKRREQEGIGVQLAAGGWGIGVHLAAGGWGIGDQLAAGGWGIGDQLVASGCHTDSQTA